MEATPSDESAAPRRANSPAEWLLFRGSRLTVAALVLGLMWATTVLLVETNLLEMGRPSSMPLLMSGVVAGQLTLITVTLSINQLILSRMFATPAEITDRLGGVMEFRRTVRGTTDGSSSPIEPREFFAAVAHELGVVAADLGRSADAAGAGRAEEVGAAAASLGEYAETVERIVDNDGAGMLYVVSALPHGQHADNTVAIERLRADDAADSLPESADGTLEDAADLLEAVIVAKQHFKTLAIQQQLARLSRYVVYTGVPSIFVAALLMLAYTSSGVPKVPEGAIRPIASLSIPVFLAPSVVLSAYVLPLAVVAERTVATGPFTPPE